MILFDIMKASYSNSDNSIILVLLGEVDAHLYSFIKEAGQIGLGYIVRH